MEIDGRTRLCGLIGNPVEHTLSPAIHNTLAQQMGINMVYLPFYVEKGDLSDAVKGALALNVLGVNVTIPYKTDVIGSLVETDPLAKAVESVNTLVRTEGGFKGYNTDMSGLYRAMREDGVSLEGEDVIILGAGGVGRTVAFLCAMKGAGQVWLLNRSVKRAQEVAQEVTDKTGTDRVRAMALSDWKKIPEGKYLVIQCTSVGLHPNCGEAVIEDPAFYERVHTGYDLIYRPAVTKFMTLVENAGGRAYNGLKMLVYQGVEAFEKWNDVTVTAQQASGIYELVKDKVEQK